MSRASRMRGPAVAATAALALVASPALAELPPENRCPTISGSLGNSDAPEDAAPIRLKEGMTLSYGAIFALRDLIPREVWHHRNVFFFEGMRMEMGPCHRRYPVAAFYAEATEKFAGRARIDERGNLHGYVAGAPFPQDAIDPQVKDAGARWAWNYAYRYRGAGAHGKFRIVEMARIGGAHTYRGSFFFLQTMHRADLGDSDYAVPAARRRLWISGGRFDEPFAARHLAWRQMRPAEAETRYAEPDDTFVYVPTMRKVRRSPTSWVDGMFTPRYRVGGDVGGGGVAFGDGFGPTGSLNPTSAQSAAQAEHLPVGFTTLAIRPNAYVWKVLGEREVLAPINGSRPGYPRSLERNFGPSGLSVASDRWDVRYAVVIQGEMLRRGEGYDRVVLYLDYQTLQPLYLIKKRRGGRLLEVGIPVHRFSGDVFSYPDWPDGQDAWVFDPVAAVFARTQDASGWRRESYDVRSVPAKPSKQARFVSADFLLRGR